VFFLNCLAQKQGSFSTNLNKRQIMYRLNIKLRQEQLLNLTALIACMWAGGAMEEPKELDLLIKVSKACQAFRKKLEALRQKLQLEGLAKDNNKLNRLLSDGIRIQFDAWEAKYLTKMLRTIPIEIQQGGQLFEVGYKLENLVINQQ